ncbi:hypothetical protein [Rhodohalobacter sp. 8-1]|uniref:hypothetical protein n=1 Tax=Rhodohalobacter sp. 8-1 TaxID=3131972 RepID=UPI0030EEA09E
MIDTSSASRALAIFIAGISLMAGCSTFDADYERDNPSDPKSTNFTHSKPGQFTVEIEEGVIDIRWEDVSQYNSGYIVEKAIDDSTEFERVAKLPEDAEHFRDSGKQIGLTVYYKISSFVDEDDDEKIVHSETLELSVQAIETYDGFSSDSNLIKLSWQTEQEFSDGVIIQQKSQGQSEFTTVEVIDFADQESPGGNYEYRSDLETFNLDVRLTTFQYQEGEIVPIQHLDKSFSINDPENFNITFINELETQVEWENSIDFADHYLLTVKHEQSGTVQRYEFQPDEFSQVVDMEMKRGWSRYTLFGVLEDEQSSPIYARKSFYVSVPRLSYSSTSLSAITLTFEDNSDAPPRYSAIIVERSVNEAEFETYAELPATQSEFTDKDLQVSNSYSYRLRTLTRVGNQVIDLTGENRLIPVEESNISYTGSVDVTRDEIVHFIDSNRLVFYKNSRYGESNSSLEIINTNNLNERTEFESGKQFYVARVSPSGNKVAEFVDGEAFGDFALNIWDMNTRSIIQTIPQAHNETGVTSVIPVLRIGGEEDLVASSIINSEEPEIKMWNIQSGNLIHKIEIPNERIRAFEFHPTKKELIVSSNKSIYIYDTDTFQLLNEFTNLFGNDDFIATLSGNGEHLFAFSYRNLKQINLNTYDISNQKEFDHGIERLSANYDGSELFIKIYEWSGIFDTKIFELNYRLEWHYNSSFNSYMMLNPKSQNTAFSFNRVLQPYVHTDIMRWEKRDVWYEEPIRQ